MSGSSQPPARRRGKRPPRGVPVIDRAFSLLAAFDVHHPSMTLSALSRRSAIPISSARRLAARLVEWGALERGADGRFVIGLRLWEVATLAPRAHGLRQVALPYLRDLSEVTRQHILLAIREGEEALLVERLSTHQAIPVLYDVGGRLPLHSTGVGLVLLAHAPVEFQDRVLARPLTHQPENVAVSPSALRQTLAQVRRDGLATVHRQAPQPLVTVAAPIFDTEEQVVAALSVLVPEAGSDPRLLAPAVRTAARAVSRGLGSRASQGTSDPAAPVA